LVCANAAVPRLSAAPVANAATPVASKLRRVEEIFFIVVS
jgi:hypothetical protein